MPLTHAARLLAHNPAALFRIAHVKGALAVGRDADIVLMRRDPYRYSAAASGNNYVSWSPYDGIELPFRVAATFVRGAPVMAEGACQPLSPAQAGSSRHRFRRTERRRECPPRCRSTLTVSGATSWRLRRSLTRTIPTPAAHSRRCFSKAAPGLRERFAAAGLATRIDAGRQSDRPDRRQKSRARRHRDRIAQRYGAVGRSLRRDCRRRGRPRRSPARCATRQVRLDHTLEIIDFLAEEPSDYGLSCIGSRGMAGALEARMLDMTEPHGETLRGGVAPGRRQSGLPRVGEARRHQGVSGIAHRAGHRARIAIARCRYRHLDRRHPPHRDRVRRRRRSRRYHAAALAARRAGCRGQHGRFGTPDRRATGRCRIGLFRRHGRHSGC